MKVNTCSATFKVSTAVLPMIYGAVQLVEWKIVSPSSSRGIPHVAVTPQNISNHPPYDLASNSTRFEFSNV
jgi:hypothetical protein